MSSEGSSILLCPVRGTEGGTHGGPSWHREAGCEDSSWDQDGGANGSPERGGVREIEQLATRVSRILSRLQETESDPAMDGAMAGLEKSLDRALNLVTTCQKRSAMHRVLRGWGHGQAAAPGAGRHTAAIDAGCLRHHYPAHPKPEHATAAGCWCPSAEVPAAFLLEQVTSLASSAASASVRLFLQRFVSSIGRVTKF